VFCYNPLDYTRIGQELSTETWCRVMGEARQMGAVQIGFSGGEPLNRDDLGELVSESHRLGYYSNLITSGVGLDEARIRGLKAAGLDHIQLSFQDSTRELNDFISHTRTFERKARVARLIKDHGFPMVLNVVLHRLNIDHVEDILAMAERMGAEYVELANCQYYGWAWLNRDQLMPSLEQLQRAEAATQRFREKAGQRMKIYYVVPDYHESRPKPCMNGWGSVFITVTPDGVVLPCQAARMLPGLPLPSVHSDSLRSIWQDSPMFNAFRGDSWMQEPCRSCPERSRDFGGCRCQAYLLTGDARNADPVCALSPHHQAVSQATARAGTPAAQSQPIRFRDDHTSLELSRGT
jgi:pyrroloquinoline quinone biosynthesis protein E